MEITDDLRNQTFEPFKVATRWGKVHIVSKRYDGLYAWPFTKCGYALLKADTVVSDDELTTCVKCAKYECDYFPPF